MSFAIFKASQSTQALTQVTKVYIFPVARDSEDINFVENIRTTILVEKLLQRSMQRFIMLNLDFKYVVFESYLFKLNCIFDGRIEYYHFFHDATINKRSPF